ncbi:unnamed protein product [Prunus armeniaca]
MSSPSVLPAQREQPASARSPAHMRPGSPAPARTACLPSASPRRARPSASPPLLQIPAPLSL